MSLVAMFGVGFALGVGVTLLLVLVIGEYLLGRSEKPMPPAIIHPAEWPPQQL